MYWGAFKNIKKYNPNARAYVSLDHNFGNQKHESFSGFKVLEQVSEQSHGQQYHVAIHPYSKQVGSTHFSSTDMPFITYVFLTLHFLLVLRNCYLLCSFGTLNVLTGWLQQRHPTNTPTVMITEVGFTSSGPGFSEQAQEEALCRAYRQALATPGITGFIYHRFKDHPDETSSGLYCGLKSQHNQFKQAWSKWALMDRRRDSNDCGFEYENGKMVKLIRYRNSHSKYWVTTRIPNSNGFVAESTSWLLSRNPLPNTRPLYDCEISSDAHFLSESHECEGYTNIGMVGYALINNNRGQTPAIYRCKAGNGHFASHSANCEGHTMEKLLGYAVDGSTINAAYTSNNNQQVVQQQRAEDQPFDCYSYIARYDDIKRAFGANCDQVKQHFLTQGFNEKRSAVFNRELHDRIAHALDTIDCRFYMAKYSDVGSDCGRAIEHYKKYGFKEGRVGNIPFDCYSYLARYKDLRMSMGFDCNAATEHWYRNGVREQRNGQRDASLHSKVANFNCHNYMNRYNDIKTHVQGNCEKAKQHYIEHGLNEGRNGS